MRLNRLYIIGIVFTLLTTSFSCITPPPINEPPVNQPEVTIPPYSDNNNKTEDKPSEKSTSLKLSLEQCLQIALENNRQLLISREEMVKARGKLKEAKSLTYPRINANLSYTRVDEVSKFNMNGMEIETGSLDNYKAEASITQFLYQGGKVNAMISSAKIGLQLAETQFIDMKEVIIFQVIKTYYDVLLNQEIMTINQKSLTNAIAHLDNVKLLKQQGVASDYEVLRAEVQVSNLRTLLLQSESNLRLTKLSLLRIMGAPTDDEDAEVELTDQMEHKPQEINFKQTLEVAFQMRPDLAQARLMVDIQKKNITITKADLRPNLSLFASAGEEKPSRKAFGEVEWGDYWNTGAMISFPIFEGGRTRGKLIQERATLHQYQIALRDTEEKIRYEVKQAILSLKDAEALINSQKENVKQAEEGLRLAELGFKNGVNTQLEVMDTQMALDIARKNYLSTIYNYNLAQLMLKKAMGVLERK